MYKVTNLTVMYFFMQLMKMKTSYYGAQVHCQKARLEVSCLKCCHGQQMKRQDVTNQGSMFETMNRSVMSFIYQSFHVVTTSAISFEFFRLYFSKVYVIHLANVPVLTARLFPHRL